MWQILADELIGLEVKVEESTDPGKKGVEGIVIDETAKMLVIRRKNGKVVKVPKSESVFVFLYRGKRVRVDGRMLVSRPEDRIKKALHLRRKWHIPAFFFKGQR